MPWGSQPLPEVEAGARVGPRRAEEQALFEAWQTTAVELAVSSLKHRGSAVRGGGGYRMRGTGRKDHHPL